MLTNANDLTGFTFSVKKASGNFTDVLDLVGGSNDDGTENLFAAHIKDMSVTIAGNTGYVTTGAAVPEPGYMAMLGLGSAALIAYVRRRKQSEQ